MSILGIRLASLFLSMFSRWQLEILLALYWAALLQNTTDQAEDGDGLVVGQQYFRSLCFCFSFGLNETLFDRDQYNENLKRLERVKSLDSKSQFDEVDSQSEYSTFEQRPYFIGTEVRGSSSQISACAFKQYFNSLTLTLRVLLFPAVIYTGIVWGWQNAWMSFYTTTLIDDYSKILTISVHRP